MNTYVAFLRGINIGGKTVTMDVLKKSLEAFGCQNVRTILATGNVVFDVNRDDEKELAKQLEENLAVTFGFAIAVLLRPLAYIKQLVTTDPFKTISILPGTRLSVSFLAPHTKSTLVIPYESPDKTFRLISMTQAELFCVITPEGKTTDAMELIEKKFGNNVTTRNWNTIKKIALPTSSPAPSESTTT